jgi:GNAT superfamily N-acetyltransferase
MASVTLEPVRETDAPALADLRALAMRPSLEAAGRFDPQRARHRFLSTFRAQDTWHVLLDGMRAGVVVIRIRPADFLLDHLYVHPTCQGRGVGSIVVQQLQARARAAGKSVVVSALKGSRSNDFYLRHGFRLTGQEAWDNHYAWRPHDDESRAQ